MLLLAATMAFVFSVPPEKYQEWSALVSGPPEPSNCDWTTLPMGDKHCHYQPVFHHVNELGRRVTITWRRVND